MAKKSYKKENKVSWMGLVDTELANIKKGQVSITSRYWKPKKVHDYATSKYGFQFSPYDMEHCIGSVEEWLKAFRNFCKRKVNTKGQKVNRTHLLKYGYNSEKFGRNYN